MIYFLSNIMPWAYVLLNDCMSLLTDKRIGVFPFVGNLKCLCPKIFMITEIIGNKGFSIQEVTLRLKIRGVIDEVLA